MKLEKFKTFENRGDGVEDENGIVMPPKQLEFDFDNKLTLKKPSIAKDYVLFLPSGEIITLDDANDLLELIDRNLVDYNYSYKGVILNCYCAQDKILSKVKDVVSELSNKKDKDDDKYKSIALEYTKAMGKITRKDSIVGHFKSVQDGFSRNIDSYYLVIPDLIINSHYYRRILEEMIEMTKTMRKKHPLTVFSFTDRINKTGVKYYNIPFGS